MSPSNLPSEQLEGLCERALRALSASVSLPGWSDEAARVCERLMWVQAELKRARRPLTLMLFGGTGVGKSSLLNALAGAQVSEASAGRRAFTTRLQVYHHHDDPLSHIAVDPSLIEAHPHSSAALKDKLIIDAPDMDSAAREHHELVWATLPYVDVVIYVTSWQKYRDRVICEALTHLKGEHSLLCVLNQSDDLEREAREEVSADLSACLAELGLGAPPVLALSAREAEVRQHLTAPPPLEGEEALRWEAFTRLNTLLREELTLNDLKAMTALSLTRKALRALGYLPYELGLGAGGLEVALSSLSTQGEALSGLSARLSLGLSDALKRATEEALSAEVSGAHLARDELTPGLYQRFLKAQAWLWQRGYGRPPLSFEAPSPLSPSQLQEVLSAPLQSARRELSALQRRAPSMGEITLTPVSSEALALLSEALTSVTHNTLPRLTPRPAWQLNFAPWVGVSLVVWWALTRLWEGREPGLLSALLALALLFALCALQYSLLSATDTRTLRRASPLSDEALEMSLSTLGPHPFKGVTAPLEARACELLSERAPLEALLEVSRELAELHRALGSAHTRVHSEQPAPLLSALLSVEGQP